MTTTIDKIPDKYAEIFEAAASPKIRNHFYAEWSEMAGEPVEVVPSKGAVYGFASELGVLRIFSRVNFSGAVPNKDYRMGFSKNLNEWYIVRESS